MRMFDLFSPWLPTPIMACLWRILPSQSMVFFIYFVTLVQCLFERNALVASTNCPSAVGAVLAKMDALPNYRFQLTFCDEVDEFNAITKLHLFMRYRVIILLVTFPANCRAVGILHGRIRRPGLILLIGCEQVPASTKQVSNNSSVVLSLSTPSWYPAWVFRHLAKRPSSRATRSLIAAPDCSDIASELLRNGETSFGSYLDLLPGTQEIELDESRAFICLSIHDVENFPVIKNFRKKSITVFVKDSLSKTHLLETVVNSPNLINMARLQPGSVSFVSYINERNETDELFSPTQVQDLEKSFVIAKLVLDQDHDVFENVDYPAGLLVFLTDRHITNIFVTWYGFVQLPKWEITSLKSPDENQTTLAEALIVSVVADDNYGAANVTNSTKLPFGTSGFYFTDSYDWRWDLDSENSTTGASALLQIYIPAGIGSLVLVVGPIVAVAIFRRRYLGEVSKERSKFFLTPDDLTPISKRSNTSLSVNSTNSGRPLSNGHANQGDVGKSLASVRTTDSDTAHELGLSAGDNYAKFNGDIMFLRYIRTKNLQLKTLTKQLINNMRELRGDNINAFVAFFLGCPTPFRPPAVVFEYCSRGSLMDLIDKEEIKLDWSFKVSFLTDLVRGVKAIHHSSIKFHGRLTSRKCVIDNRWTLKVTDYAISRLELHQNGDKPVESPSAEQLLWTAPEVLRNPTLLGEGSQKADVYTVGIITQELILRGRPFCTAELTPQEIVQKIRHPPPLLRPHVPNQTAQPEAIMIMKECWSENPEIRPTIDEIIIKFKTLSQGRKVNIVDSMFVMLEKYSNNLEELIHERTEELNEEKKKTEQLLYRMMPQTVAEKLKTGEPVEPESFAEVTIYFSDIVGFTTISAYSTPMEVVNLLNDLYSLFDTTLSNYDVYKVETIGDAYMVVSGLPIANGNKHAGEIASVALDLLYQCGKFKIRHLYEIPLLLRIGIHTGSCAAGVVGLTMPRYCLFGDTVNTASRMESTSRAYRIHVSETAQTKLNELGGYKMVFRGITQVKGKGDMNTYWLEGKDGFDKPLPPPSADTGENHGIDEKLIIKGRELQKLYDAKASANRNSGEEWERNGFTYQYSVDDRSDLLPETNTIF